MMTKREEYDPTGNAGLWETGLKWSALEAGLHAAALAAHPGYEEVTHPLVRLNGRTFAKIDEKAPATRARLIAWLKKHRPEEALRVATELGFAESAL